LSALTDLDVGGVTALSNVLLHATPSINLTVNKVAFTGDGTAAGNFENSKIKSLVITSSDVTLTPRTFKDCNSLTSVSFPDNFGAKVIAVDAFKGCKALSGVVFPGSEGTAWTGSIAAGAFDGCTSLATVTLPVIPSGAAGINATAFGGSDAALRTLTLGGNLAADTAAFANKTNLTTVILNAVTEKWSSNVTLIPASTDATAGSTDADKPGVFEGCTRLSIVRFPTTGFTVIGAKAFKGCRQLSVDLPNALLTTDGGIGNSAFENCISMESITIPVGITIFAQRVFKGTRLQTLTIPYTVTNINDEAFASIPTLTKVTLGNTSTNPSGLLSLGDTNGGSFADCTSLATFGIAGTRTVSGTTVTLPITGVCEIPAVLTSVKPDSFKNTKFDKIVIDSVNGTSIAGAAFSGAQFAASSLEVKGTAAAAGFDFSKPSNGVPSIRTIIWGVDGLTANDKFDGTSLQTLVLTKKQNTTPVAVYPESGFTTLKIDVDEQDANIGMGMPNTITTVIIGEKTDGTGIIVGGGSGLASTFEAGNTVKNLTFTGAVGILGIKFFDNLTGLKVRIDNAGVNIPSPNVADRGKIPASVFGVGAQDAIEEVSLGTLVKDVDSATNFVGASLKAINVDSGSNYYDNFQNDSVLYSKVNGKRDTIIRYPPAKVAPDGKYETPYDVVGIGAIAFKNNASITELTISAPIANIANLSGGESAFEGMSGLTKVNFLATRLSDGGLATTSKFPQLADNTEFAVVFGEAVTRIPASFAGTAIIELIIPANVTKMAPNAFVSCANLEDVRFEAVELLTDSGDSVAAFSGVSSLVRLNIGSSVKVIPADTFKGTMITGPMKLVSVVTIGEGAFENCSKLSGTFDIPATCTSIGDRAFGSSGTYSGPSISGFYLRRDDTTIAAETAFKAAGSNGDDLADLYVIATNKAGYYYWDERDSTDPDDDTWVYRKLNAGE
jgi:hypothetical protein